MNNPQHIKKGVIMEIFPDHRYSILLDGQLADGDVFPTVKAYLGGKMKINRIKVMVGDKVELLMDTLGPNNRVIRRL